LQPPEAFPDALKISVRQNAFAAVAPPRTLLGSLRRSRGPIAGFKGSVWRRRDSRRKWKVELQKTTWNTWASTLHREM